MTLATFLTTHGWRERDRTLCLWEKEGRVLTARKAMEVEWERMREEQEKKQDE